MLVKKICLQKNLGQKQFTAVPIRSPKAYLGPLRDYLVKIGPILHPKSPLQFHVYH